jgi:hypothetical protein
MNRLLPIVLICVLAAGCARKPPPPPVEPPLAGPGEFKVLPDGRLVVEKPVRNP